MAVESPVVVKVLDPVAMAAAGADQVRVRVHDGTVGRCGDGKVPFLHRRNSIHDVLKSGGWCSVLCYFDGLHGLPTATAS